MASMIRGTLPRTLTAVRGASTFAHRHCIRTRSVRSLEVYRPTILQLTRLQPLSVSVKRLDAYHDKTRKLEDELGKEKLVPHPEQVSATSSVHEILHEKGRSENPDEDDVDMLAGVKSDWVRRYESVDTRGFEANSRDRKRSRRLSQCKRFQRKPCTWGLLAFFPTWPRLFLRFTWRGTSIMHL